MWSRKLRSWQRTRRKTKMITAFALMFASAASPPVMPVSVAGDFIDVTMKLCYGIASGEVQFDGSVIGDAKVLSSRNVAAGLRNGTMDRLGRQSLGLISQSVIGERLSGEDTVVIAVGGTMPGCRTILLSKVVDGHDATIAKMLVADGWKEVPASNAPNAAVNRRMFTRRDAKAQAYLINMFAGTLAQSDFRIMTTVNPIPISVQLPEGF